MGTNGLRLDVIRRNTLLRAARSVGRMRSLSRLAPVISASDAVVAAVAEVLKRTGGTELRSALVTKDFGLRGLSTLRR